jgi:hypothetical protein
VLDDARVARRIGRQQMDRDRFRLGALRGEDLRRALVQCSPLRLGDVLVGGGADDRVNELEWLTGIEHGGLGELSRHLPGHWRIESGECRDASDRRLVAEDRDRVRERGPRSVDATYAHEQRGRDPLRA